MLAEGSDGGNRTQVAIHDALASVYAEAGQHTEAEHQYQRALEMVSATSTVSFYSASIYRSFV